MPFFRRKPFVIQAHRLRDEDGEVQVASFGRMFIAKPGDWIMGDEKGQSVTPDRLFRELYEPVDDEARQELAVKVGGPA